jgi:hypothetical protein
MILRVFAVSFEGFLNKKNRRTSIKSSITKIKDRLYYNHEWFHVFDDEGINAWTLLMWVEDT